MTNISVQYNRGNKNPLGKHADHEKKNITTHERRNNARVYYVLKVP